MLNDIYNKRIIELAGNIPRLGRLPDPHASATAHSKLCGSTVKVDLKMDGPVVTDFAHDVKACALGQASSSIMARHVVGSNANELRELRETVRRMLKENGARLVGNVAVPEDRHTAIQIRIPSMSLKITPVLNKKLKSVKLFLCDVDGVLTDGTVYMGGGVETKRFNIRDGLGLKFLQVHGIKVGWVSRRPSSATQQRADDLKIDFLVQHNGGKIEGVEGILRQTGMTWEVVCCFQSR